MVRTRRTDVVVGWFYKLTVVGLVAVGCFVAAVDAQVSIPPTAELQRTVDKLVQEEVTNALAALGVVDPQ